MPETATVENLPTLRWDTYEITKHQAEYLMEEDPELSEDDAFSQACSDSDLYAFEFECFCDNLTEDMKEINPDGHRWGATVNNFGWRGISGRTKFKAETGQEFLQNVLPDCDCTYSIWVDKETKTIKIDNAHHDKPTGGEIYDISPVLTCDQCGDDENEVETIQEDGDTVVRCERCREE